MINVFLAEDHLILRDGIKSLLKDYEDVCVVGEANNGNEVMAALQHTQVDVLIMDLNMPEMDGIQTTEAVREKYKDVKVMVLSMLDNDKYVAKSFQAGALGYVLKTAGKDELIHAIRNVAKGSPYISHSIALTIIKKLDHVSVGQAEPIDLDLSSREVEILNLIAEGYTNTEIAEKTFTSKRTVETHRKNLIEKTGAKNTASLIKFAIVNGILK